MEDTILMSICDKSPIDGCFNEDVAEEINIIYLHVPFKKALELLPTFLEEGLYVEIEQYHSGKKTEV